MTQAFNLSQFANKVNTSGQADLSTAATGTLPVANGGSGQTTYTDGQLLIGNTTGNTLTKATLTAGTGISVTNGSGSITIANTSTGGQLKTELFTTPGTWTQPATATQVRVTVVGGGAGGSPGANQWSGGRGGLAIAIVPVSAPVSVTVGAGGAQGASGATSSFGPAASATGGGTAPFSPPFLPGPPGAGTVAVGTALKTGSITTGVGNTHLLIGAQTRVAGSPVPAEAYSTSSIFIAGAAGVSPAPGGLAGGGGGGGAVLVEFVG